MEAMTTPLLSERNRTIALVGAIAIVMLVLVALAYALIAGRPLDSFLPTLIGFATPTIVSLMTAAGVHKELTSVHEKVNGNYTNLAQENARLTGELTELATEIHQAGQQRAGAHRKDDPAMPTATIVTDPRPAEAAATALGAQSAPPLHFDREPDMTFTAATSASVGEDRIVSGLALPFGEVGAGSRGRVKATRGKVTIPPDLKRVKLLSAHTGTAGSEPVGYAVAAEEKEDGIHMSFRIADTPAGNAALTEIREGVRDALSVELADALVSGTGDLQASLMTAVSLTPTPAFPSARILKASLMPSGHQVTGAGGQIGNGGQDDRARLDNGPQVTFGNQPAPLTFDRYVDAIMMMRTDPHNTDLHAALADITIGGQPYTQAPDYIGELWSGLSYRRRIVPLLGSGRLTSQKVIGWRWKTKPEVDDYAGNKAAIPSNPVETEQAETTAKRLAGGHDIDRAFFDFPNREFLDAYFRAQGEDYAYKSDMKAAQFLVDNATKIPVAQAQPDLLRAAAKARQTLLIGTRGQEPDYFLVNPNDMFSLLDFTTMDNPAYLKLVGVDPEKFIPAELVPAGAVIAGARPAATFYELPGSPIRVQAEHIAQGGRDAAVFGYWAALLHDARGVVSVPFAPAPAGQ